MVVHIWMPHMQLDRGSLVIDLGRQVVLEDAELLNFVLNHEWLLLVQAQARVLRQRRRLVEHVKVANGELLLNGVSHLYSRLFVTAGTLVGAKADRARARLRLNSKCHCIGVSLDSQCLAKRVELLADLGELAGVDGDD